MFEERIDTLSFFSSLPHAGFKPNHPDRCELITLYLEPAKKPPLLFSLPEHLHKLTLIYNGCADGPIVYSSIWTKMPKLAAGSNIISIFGAKHLNFRWPSRDYSSSGFMLVPWIYFSNPEFYRPFGK